MAKKSTFTNCGNVITLNPKDADAYYNRGFDRLEAGKNKEALLDFNKVIELNPNHYKAYHNRGFVKANLNQLREAILDMDEAIKLHPGDAGLHFNRGIMHSNLNQYEEAIFDFDQVVSLTPDDAQAHFMRGKAKLHLGKQFSGLNFDVTDPDTGIVTEVGAEARVRSLAFLSEAMVDFEQSMALDPDDDDAPNQHARAKDIWMDGRLIQRIYQLNTVIAKNPNDAEAYDERGFAKFKLNEDEEDVIADFNKAISLNPHCAVAYFHRGLLKDKNFQLNEAIADYDSAISINPNDAEFFYSRGLAKFNLVAAQKLNAYPEAMADLDKAIAIDPNHFNAYNGKGYIFYYMGKSKSNYQNAITLYDQAVQLGLKVRENHYRDAAVEALVQSTQVRP